MYNIIQEFHTRLRYKIVLPFLLLTFIVALVGYSITFILEAKNIQESFSKDVAEKARMVNHNIVQQERANLQFLIEVVYAPENTFITAPAVADAIERDDQEGLQKALEPYFLQGMQRNTVQLDRLIAFNNKGYSLVDLERPPQNVEESYIVNEETLDFTQMWTYVRDVLNLRADSLGDKYAGRQFQLMDSTGQISPYFPTIAPVTRQDTETQEQKAVGGIIVAMRIDTLVESLIAQSQADVVVFYDANGYPQVSNLSPDNGLDAFTMDDTVQQQLELSYDIQMNQTSGNQDTTEPVFDTMTVDGTEYQFLFNDLFIRSGTTGIVATGLSRKEFLETWAQSRTPLIGVTLALMFGIIAMGLFVARQITAPLEELATTAQAVTHGHFERRSTVRSNDEIGVLSASFNQMTEHLLNLFGQVLTESGQRAAIVESIADGIVVCDSKDNVQLINRATSTFLGLQEGAHFPGRFTDFPFLPIEEAVFGSQQKDIYWLGSYIVRISKSPVTTFDGTYLGNVYVLQDLTEEVNIDRAKTGFIATISHEMRTPLTSMRGNLDMLIHGIAGPLNDEQLPMLQTIGQQTTNMTRLVNNMILVAGLDSGSTSIELEPVNLKSIVDKAVWPLRKGLKAKGLSLTVDVPGDLPQVQADPIQLRTVMQQLMENARVYTDTGGVTIRASQQDAFVRIDVSDTGCGIEDEMIERVFERFVRGADDKSNDRPDRGIGLGLAIVRDIVERHGGRVWVESKLGEGSTFSFTLRCVEETSEPEEPTISEAA